MEETKFVPGEVLSEEEAEKLLKGEYKKAEEELKHPDRVEQYLREAEDRMKRIPKAGPILANVPLLVSLIRAYIKREYRKVPIGCIIAILAAILYFVSPIDLIPDAIPVIGVIDDVAVIGFCLKLCGSDLEEYKSWRLTQADLVDEQ